MARLADRLVDRSWHFPLGLNDAQGFMADAAASVQSSPVIVADNVARYINDLGEIDLCDFPSLAPPWPQFWIEYPSTSGRQRRGVWVVDSTEMSGHFADLARSAQVHPLRPRSVRPGRWVVTFVLFVESTDRGVWGPLGMSSLTLDDDGAVTGHAYSIAPVLEISEMARERVQAKPDLPSTRSLPTVLSVDEIKSLSDGEASDLLARSRRHEAELKQHLKALDERIGELESTRDVLANIITTTDHQELDDAWLIRALAPAYQAVALLHCKNVQLDETVPSPKVQARRRRNGREPLVRYHTLRLDVPRRSSGRHANGVSSSSALHIVAGHFAHYGACCSSHEPHGMLFGRLEGVYWVPMHARGNRDLGRVRTDFDLQMPA